MIIIGAGYGDEGKGLAVSKQVHDKSIHGIPLVVRFNGGGQAGHTVVMPDGRRHVHSNLGSGSLQNADTLWLKYCTFDPGATFTEMNAIGFNQKFYVDGLCPVVTPYDIYLNQNNSVYEKNGTVGCGIGTTFRREENHYHLTVLDILTSPILNFKLEKIAEYYRFDRRALEFLEPAIIQFKQYCELIADKITVMNDDNIHILMIHAYNANRLIFEGAQGILLDQFHGIFPNVTRSFTTSKNAVEALSLNQEVMYVSRVYHTRHGNGPWSGDLLGTSIRDLLPLRNNENETNKPHQFQGQFKTSLLDLRFLNHSLRVDNAYASDNFFSKNLLLTCIDQIDPSGNLWIVNSSGKLQEIHFAEIPKYLNTKFDNVYISKGPSYNHIEQIS